VRFTVLSLFFVNNGKNLFKSCSYLLIYYSNISQKDRFISKIVNSKLSDID
jgi:hypothetical protein